MDAGHTLINVYKRPQGSTVKAKAPKPPSEPPRWGCPGFPPMGAWGNQAIHAPTGCSSKIYIHRAYYPQSLDGAEQ